MQGVTLEKRVVHLNSLYSQILYGMLDPPQTSWTSKAPIDLLVQDN